MSVDYNTPVDPRVQIELEKLNTATNHINQYEQKLDEAKLEFKKLLEESVVRIKQSAHKLGNSIEAAKPYYEARLYATQLTKETQQAIVNYEKAKSIHAAAKEMVYLAEQGLGEKSTLDTACQEMLSHAASRVNESQLECSDTRNILKISELKQEVSNNRVIKLQAQLKSAIKASSYNIRRKLLFMNLLAYQHDLCLPYYETRANYNGLLKNQKEKITILESKVSDAKMSYNEALKNLERISDEIHKMRQEQRLLNNYNNLNSPEQSNIKNCSLYLDNHYQQQQLHSNNDSGNNFITSSSSSSSATGIKTTNKYSSKIDTCDEYLDLPPKLNIKSSPIRQCQLDKHDCPHLLKDFENSRYFTGDIYENCNDNDIIKLNPTSSSTLLTNLTDDIEQWTEIRLSNSESTSSGYSHHDSILIDDRTPDGGVGNDNDDDDNDNTSSSDDNKKITCTTVFNGGDHTTIIDKKSNESGSGGGITSWITRSNSIKTTGGRRQSLDLLIDASDRVKDVFTSSFQKVGKSLERRNSESEVNNENTTTDFFSFTRADKDGLTDEQVENLLLNEENNDNDNINFIVKGVNDISKKKIN